MLPSDAKIFCFVLLNRVILLMTTRVEVKVEGVNVMEFMVLTPYVLVNREAAEVVASAVFGKR